MAFKSAARRRDYYRQWSAENPEKARAAQTRHRLKHPERIRARHRKHRYGLTAEAFEKMKADQDGLCAICRREPATTKRGIFVVDHDHETKRVRALLCNDCNVAVANVRESVDTALALVAYLLRHKQVQA